MFEADTEKVLEELKELFYVAPPHKLKEYLLEVYFTYLIELETQDYPNNHREITEGYYSIITFLTKLNSLNEHSSPTST